MPRKQIIPLQIEVEADQAAYLEEMAQKYGLADQSKALRVLLDYAIQDADDDTIFDMSTNMRCRHCVI